MGNSQNFSDTEISEGYLQLETVSGSMEQFVDKWQKKCASLTNFFRKTDFS